MGVFHIRCLTSHDLLGEQWWGLIEQYCPSTNVSVAFHVSSAGCACSADDGVSVQHHLYQCSDKGWKCGAVALVPQNISVQVTSGLEAIQLIGLQGHAEVLCWGESCMSSSTGMNGRNVCWDRTVCGKNSSSGARGVQGQSLDCSHELHAGWGWKSVKDQCKVLSAFW